jgi:hypothetical protein
MVETIENRVSYTSRTSASPEQRGMKVVTFPIPTGLEPYRVVLLGRTKLAPWQIDRGLKKYDLPWLCLTPTPVGVARPPYRTFKVTFERPHDEEMEYMVAWLVE